MVLDKSAIMGHSLPAVGLLAQAAGVCLAVPVAARIAGQIGRLAPGAAVGTIRHGCGRRLLRCGQVRPRPLEPGPSLGHARAEQWRGLLPALTAQRQTARTALSGLKSQLSLTMKPGSGFVQAGPGISLA
jgi:hypothetical protein